MKRKATLLLVVATLLLALQAEAGSIRQTLKLSPVTILKTLAKTGKMKGAKKALPQAELRAAQAAGHKQALRQQKGNRQAPPRQQGIAQRKGAAALAPTPVSIPYEADFTLSDAAMDDFIIINNNEDLSDGEPCTWLWSSSGGAYYMYNVDGETAADDYLVLPIVLEQGLSYDVAVNAAAWNYTEEFEVVAGAECSAEALTTTIIGKTTPENDAADYVGTFVPDADGVYYIAIHATSAADQFMLSVYRFSIDLTPNPAAPAAVSGFSVRQVENELKTALTFTAPTLSIGGDALAGNITIEMLRNGEPAATLTDVAPGETQTYIDDVPAEGTYHYQLIACNTAGKGSKSKVLSVMVGLPQDVPYIIDFAEMDVFDKLTVIDNNDDGDTWSIDYSVGAASYHFNWDNSADDYLVTQPLNMQGGQSYDISVSVASSNASTTERFEVLVGNNPSVDALNTIAIEPTDVTSQEFVEYAGTFTADETGVYYVAVHAISDADQFYLLVSHLSVVQGAAFTAPAAPTLTATAAAEGALSATVVVTAPTQCIDGSALTAITKMELYSDNSLIAQQDDVTPGANVSFTDDLITASGLYQYHAIAYNESGHGEKSEKLPLYVGLDQPAAPENVVAVDHGSTVDFSWDAVVTGRNNGYVDPANINYDIWKVYATSFYVIFEEKLASVSGQTTATANFNTDEGDLQDYTYFAVRATNEATEDEDNAEWGYTSLLTGKPYDMPMTEGFTDNELHYFWESNGLLMTSEYTSDGDLTALALLAERPGRVLFMSGKLNLKDTTDPKLVFSAMSPSIGQLHILGDIDGQDEWQLLQTISLTDDDYQSYQVSLASLKNHGRYARIALVADYETAATIDAEGMIEDLGDYIFIDGIHIGDFLDDDLAVSASTPENVVAGTAAPIIVTVENVGLKAAAGYTVSVKAGEDELLSETVEDELMPFAKKEFMTQLSTTVFDEGRVADLVVTVDYAADQNNDNNGVAGGITIVEAEGAAPEELVATESEDGIELTWTAPASAAEEYTEDFENGPGEFTQIDGNADGYGWVYMNQDELMSHSGTGALQSYSYVPGVGAVYVDNWVVTPLAILDGTFSFWAAAQDGDWPDEHFAVFVSTTGNASADDFQQVSEEFVATGFSTEYTVDLSSFAGQTGYIAIRHFNTYDQFALVVDDISFIKAPVVPVGYNIYVDQQLIATVDGATTTYTVEMPSSGEGEYTIAVTAVYANGKESKPATATLTVTTDISQIAADGKPVDIYSLDGKLLRRQATTLDGLNGIYIVNGKAVMVK